MSPAKPESVIPTPQATPKPSTSFIPLSAFTPNQSFSQSEVNAPTTFKSSALGTQFESNLTLSTTTFNQPKVMR